jgi:membrane protease YdiL (CAAX protease family)
MSLSPRRFILSFLLLILCGWGMGNFYGALGTLMTPSWLPIACIHSTLALVFLRLAPGDDASKLPILQSFVPAFGILLGCLILGLGSRLMLGPVAVEKGTWDWSFLAFILWIPLIEECVFRLGFGGIVRQKLGLFWGSYGSALVFALAHGGISLWPNLSLGPLLLGLGCEWIFIRTGRLSAAIAFHAACNGSAGIFSSLDSRWLQWLQLLYLKV